MNSYWRLSSLVILLFPLAAKAQVAPDSTMGSQVIRDVTINQILSDKIDGGQQRGNNLFHSFSEFNVGNGRGVYFTNPTNVTNIFTRVTGTSASRINGVLGVQGDANLFLMNPNGVVFGTGTSLNLNGSFLVTTANSINFADGAVFSTIPQGANTDLLSVSVPVGLGFGSSPGAIQVQGVGHNLTTTDITFRPYTTVGATTGLQVKPGKTLAMVGGEVNLNGGVLTAPGGHIELGSVGASSQVGLNATTQSFKFDYGLAPLQNIQLSEKALVNVSGVFGLPGVSSGSVQVQGNQVRLSGGANIWSQNRGLTPGGDINIRAAQLLELNGTTPDEKLRTGIISESLRLGASGNINISTRGLMMQNGATIGTKTFSPAPSGNVTVNASEFVEMGGLSPLTKVYNTLGSMTFFATRPEDKPILTAKAGDVTVSTGRLSIKDASYLTALSFGDSPGGNLSINTDTTEVIGGSTKVAGLSGYLASAISSVGYVRGDSGNIALNTRTLSVKDGAMISTSNIGTNNAGNLIINASESIDVAGVLSASGEILAASNISSTIGTPSAAIQQIPTYRALGNAGRVNINTSSLTVSNGGSVSVGNFGKLGEAGKLSINANNIQLNNQARINASSVSGKEGDIILKSNNILLRRQSEIGTNALGTGNGGNITIDADTITQLENSDITANSIQGKGGDITIITQGIFSSPDSLITATGSITGEIRITTPDIKQDNSLKQQSSEIVNTEQVIASSCLAKRNEQQGSFVTTGNGGLPQAPGNDLDLTYTVAQIRPVNIPVTRNTQNSQVNSYWKPGENLHEATQLIKTQDGRLLLAVNHDKLAAGDLVCN